MGTFAETPGTTAIGVKPRRAPWLKRIAWRILGAIFVLWAAAIFTFFVQELLPGIERRSRPRQDVVSVTHSFWSGAVVHATGREAFTWVLGQWNVPDVSPAAKGQGSWYSIAWMLASLGRVNSTTTSFFSLQRSSPTVGFSSGSFTCRS